MSYIWGHRGAAAYAPENTLESFALAEKMGADGIELDVQLTKDGEVVVCHDELIDRTSDHKGFLKDYTFDELRTFNFNNHMEGFDFARIPTLEEVFELVKPTKMVINIELKTGVFDYEGIEEKVIALADKYEMQDRIIYSSFNHYTMKHIRELLPTAYCAFLHCDKTMNMASYAKENKMDALHPVYYFLIDQRYIKEAAENGLKINAWTLDDPEYIGLAIKLGINAVITNCPDAAIAVRDKMK